MKAIVWTGQLEVRDDVEVRDLRPDEVRVRIHAAGLCHSDVSVVDGTIPFPTPVVLGHEGAGVVEEVGAAVTKVKVGDHVVLTTLGNCGAVRRLRPGPAHALPRHRRQAQGARSPSAASKAFQFANAGVFAEYTVVKPRPRPCVIDQDVPLGVGVAHRLRRAHRRRRGAQPGQAHATASRPWSSASAASAST